MAASDILFQLLTKTYWSLGLIKIYDTNNSFALKLLMISRHIVSYLVTQKFNYSFRNCLDEIYISEAHVETINHILLQTNTHSN